MNPSASGLFQLTGQPPVPSMCVQITSFHSLPMKRPFLYIPLSTVVCRLMDVQADSISCL
ncbi:mCG148384 [Mus musculus]|nr:mCG148384 [Mus musculus]